MSKICVILLSTDFLMTMSLIFFFVPSQFVRRFSFDES